LKNDGSSVALDEGSGIAADVAVDTFTLDDTSELFVGDYLQFEGADNEIQKVLEIKSVTEIKTQRGALDTTIESVNDNAGVNRLCNQQDRFSITTPAKCNSVQLDIKPDVSTYMEIEEIVFEYRPLFKETT
jgi:hypothetical protein